MKFPSAPGLGASGEEFEQYMRDLGKVLNIPPPKEKKTFNIPKSKPVNPSLLPRKHRPTAQREREQREYEESLKK
jgi:hypothetical protein